MTVLNVQVGKIVGVLEEHVGLLVEVLEARGIVREAVVIGRGGIAQKDALDLVGVVNSELWIVFHDVAVRYVTNEDELPVREGLEDALKQELAYGQCLVCISEVQRTGIE